MKTIFEMSVAGRCASSLPRLDTRQAEPLPQALLREEGPIGLPEVTEGEVMRHFIGLSSLNYHVDMACTPWARAR